MMQPYVTTVIVDEKRRIMIDLPDDMPTGPIEITARPLAAEPPPEPLTREWVRAKLRAAGLLAEMDDLPDTEELSEEEEAKLARQVAGGRPAEDYVNEDREERF